MFGVSAALTLVDETNFSRATNDSCLIPTNLSYPAPRYNSNCQLQQIMGKAKCAPLSPVESICHRQTLALHHRGRACHRLRDRLMKVSDSEHAKLFHYYQTHRLPSFLAVRCRAAGQAVIVLDIMLFLFFINWCESYKVAKVVYRNRSGNYSNRSDTWPSMLLLELC